MTDATVEQQGGPERRREHPAVPQAEDSSSSESSTDTDMGSVDACAILCDNSEVSRRDGVTGKPVAVVADGREDGPMTLDVTKWNFKADCWVKCPLLLIGSPIDSGGGDKERARVVVHLAFTCEMYETQLHGGRYFLHAHSQSADSWEQSPVLDFMNRFPDTFQTATDRACLAQIFSTV